MLFYSEKNHCLYVCQQDWDLNSHVMRVPVGAAGHVKGEQYKVTDTPRQIHIEAAKTGMIDLDCEINVMGIQYRLDLQNLRIKHLAQAVKTTSTTSGKARKGMLSWQTFQKFDLVGDLAYSWFELIGQSPAWRKLKPYVLPRDIKGDDGEPEPGIAENGWTCPECGAVNDTDSAECACGTTNDAPMEPEEPTAEPAAVSVASDINALSTLLPKRRISAQICHVEFDAAFARSKESMPMLQAVTDTMQGLLITLDQGAAHIGLRVGICQEMAKQLIKHGEFEHWRAAIFGLAWDERQLQYFHSLGRIFLQQNRHLLPNAKSDRKLLTAEDIEPETIMPLNLEGPAQEFIGDKTLADLLHDHGIKTRPTGRPRGGDHGGGAAMAAMALTPEAIKREHAREEWPELLSRLRAFIFTHRKLGYLDPTSLHEGRRAIQECIDEINKLKG
jgi:hypothetical protein